MARYQLRRPSPVRVFPGQVRRQVSTAGTVLTAGAEDEVEDGPDSPKSPDSMASEGEDSDSEDEGEEFHSSVESGAPAVSTGAPTLTGPSLSVPTADTTSQSDNAALPQITGTVSTARPSPTTTILLETSQFPRPDQPAPTSYILPSPPQPETPEVNGPPQRSFPRPEGGPQVNKGTIAAATVLSVLGAVALLLGAIIFLKRRKRAQNTPNMQPANDVACNLRNLGYIGAPETAHVDSGLSRIWGIRRNDNNITTNTNDPHLTRSTNTNTLFAPAPYTRPETVSTVHNAPPLPLPTPNPFADPPLNKAYDVLAGRPRSTTLTDRGSWLGNPFRDPESGRFDPFGELGGRR